MTEIEQYMNQFFKGTKNPSLNAMNYFMEYYHHFEKEMKFIHIAGTNGKGSCVEMMSQILVQQGYQVGKFMSPHLEIYNERMSVNGNFIQDEEIKELINELDPLIQQYYQIHKVRVTWFEFETIMALLYFYRKQVDFVILETGLGGLYDCTNVISQPLVSMITSIGYDHMDLLGKTLPEIAYQKAGISKPNSHTVFVSQTPEVNQVIQTICQEKNNQLHLIKESDITNYHYDAQVQTFDYQNWKQVSINLKGIKQIQNACLCIECVQIMRELGVLISDEKVRKGLLTVVHKGRMEVIYDHPLIIYDGAHNEPAIRNLQHSIDMYVQDTKRVYVISILKTKDYQKIVSLLMEDEKATFIFTGGTEKGAYVPGLELFSIAKKHQKENQQIFTMSLEEAITHCMKEEKQATNFIVGSFYIYGEVKKIIEKMGE